MVPSIYLSFNTTIVKWFVYNCTEWCAFYYRQNFNKVNNSTCSNAWDYLLVKYNSFRTLSKKMLYAFDPNLFFINKTISPCSVPCSLFAAILYLGSFELYGGVLPM
jgi:hypothetical protein